MSTNRRDFIKFVVAGALRATVTVVTHSCDMEHRNFTQTAPVHQVTEIAEAHVIRARIDLSSI